MGVVGTGGKGEGGEKEQEKEKRSFHGETRGCMCGGFFAGTTVTEGSSERLGREAPSPCASEK